MNLADELPSNLPGGDRQDKQAVIICLQFPIGKLQEQKALNAIFDLDDILRIVVEASSVGTYEGHKFCERPDEESVIFFIYGEDASLIYNEIKPILQSLPSLSGSYIIKRFTQFTKDQFNLNS